MAIATVNRNAIQNSPGHVYLLAAPTTVVGTTTATIVKELYGKFYTDGDIRGTLTSNVPWAVLDKSGYKDKITAKEIKIDPNDGPEELVGYEAIDYSGELTIFDVDVAHMKDVMSASAAQVLALVASVTQAGRDTLLGGGQRMPSDFMLLYRYPSKKCVGEFNNILVPCCNIVLDADRENSKSKARDLKVKIKAKPFSLLPDPTTAMPTLWLEDFVTNPKS
jgi:hypothetical protein